MQPPIIPLQEVILRDLFFIEENPNLDPERDNWVNFDKMAMLGKGTSYYCTKEYIQFIIVSVIRCFVS